MMESDSSKEIGFDGHENDGDEDAHLCIKCKMTIKGIDNYIFHRKNECSMAIQGVRTIVLYMPSLRLISKTLLKSSHLFCFTISEQKSWKK